MNEDQRNQPWEAIWYVIKSILSGIGFIAVAFLLGYWSVK